MTSGKYALPLRGKLIFLLSLHTETEIEIELKTERDVQANI
jgi:hypothetical protein